MTGGGECGKSAAFVGGDWALADFTWQNAVSGSWATHALWAGGVAPNDALAAVGLSPVGSYTVSVPGGSSFEVASVTRAAGVTLEIAGALSIAGLLSAGTTVIQAGGLLQATVPNALLQVQQGTMTNAGTLSAAASGTYLLLNNTNLTNLAGGVLSGGTYSAVGQALGGVVATIDFARSGISTEINTLNATVILRFVNSGLQGRNAAGMVRGLESTLATIGAAGSLQVLDGRDYAGATALVVGGRLELGGGALSASGGLTVAAGGTLAGFGSVGGKVAVGGTIVASGGTLALNDGVSGTGTVSIDKNATVLLPGGSYDTGFGGAGVLRATSGTLVLTAAVSGKLIFQVAPGATLDLGAAGGSALVFGGSGARVAFSGGASFTGVITGFQTSDVLEVKDVLASAAVATVSGADSVLTLTTGNGSVKLKLAGDYSGRSFAVVPDGSGGTEITVAGVSFVPASGSWGSSTVTWSFAARNDASAFAQYSSFVDPVVQAGLAALWRAAFARWAAVSGLRFVEVADTAGPGGQADIRVGWGNFGNPPAGEIGNAFSSVMNTTQKFVPGTIVRLQDPAITPLSNSGGVLLYQNTVSSAYQVMLHELGHALGLDHAAAGVDPASVMAPTAGAANRDLDISDVAGVRALYGAVVVPAPTNFAIVASDATKAEGVSGATAIHIFTVTRDTTHLGVVALNYSITPGAVRPTNAADFVGNALPQGIVSFGANETKATISVAIAGDDVGEANESYVVTLNTVPDGAVLTIASATGAILADEPIGDLAPVLGNGGKAVAVTPVYYDGPVGGVDKELIVLSSENLSIAVAGPGWFLHSGSGDDALAVASGTNVLDGGTGSNFLSGASGFDTFFVDARGATLPIWGTVSAFGKGDATTFWGVSAATHTLSWVDNEGAEGFKGLTPHASGVGVPTASLTLPGFTLAGKDTALTVLFGFDPGSSSSYMYVVAN